MSTTLEAPEVTETEGKNVLHIPDASGDTRIMWDPRNKDEVAAAQAAFDAAKGKGMLAYVVKDDGEPGEVIRSFDKKAGKIIMARQTSGG